MYINNYLASKIYKILLMAAVIYGLYLSIFYVPHDLPPGLTLCSFAIQSNILVLLSTLYFLRFTESTRLRSIFRGTVLLSILAAGLIFHLILAPQLPAEPSNQFILANHLTHTISPLGFYLDWLLFDRKGQMQIADLPFWLIYPLLYGFVFVLQGAFTDYYPYFFMDPGAIGYREVLIWLGGLLAVFILIALLILKIDISMEERKNLQRNS